MTHPLESLKTMSLSVSCFQRTSRWGCTRVYGTQTIGQQEAVLLKLIGLKLHSWLLTETLRLTRNQTPIGTLKKWIQQAKLDSNGFRRITWSTIIVLTIGGFHRELLRNAQQAHRISNYILFIYLHFLSFFYVKIVNAGRMLDVCTPVVHQHAAVPAPALLGFGALNITTPSASWERD